MKTNSLQSIDESAILDLDTSDLLRLEVAGRFQGFANIWTGVIMLHHRGKWSVYSLKDEREKQSEDE